MTHNTNPISSLSRRLPVGVNAFEMTFIMAYFASPPETPT